MADRERERGVMRVVVVCVCVYPVASMGFVVVSFGVCVFMGTVLTTEVKRKN